MDLKSLKIKLSIFLGSLALVIAFVEKDLLFIFGIFTALLFSISTDTLINYLKSKKPVVTESSIVTGLIIGYVVSSDEKWWVIALAAILAISSKHLIVFQKKHIFNPVAFGVFFVVLIFSAYTQWKASYMWYIIIPFGIYFVSKIKKLDLALSYIVISFLLYGAQAAIQEVSFSNIPGYLNYFFIFIMLIEPKTTPFGRVSKILFGGGAALLTFIFYEIGTIPEAELLGLLSFNLLTPFLKRLA